MGWALGVDRACVGVLALAGRPSSLGTFTRAQHAPRATRGTGLTPNLWITQVAALWTTAGFSPPRRAWRRLKS